jgi:hypothetical protein
MRLLQALPQSGIATISHTNFRRRFNRFTGALASLTRAFGNPRLDPISRLEGEAWTDSLERDLNNEMSVRRGLNI